MAQYTWPDISVSIQGIFGIFGLKKNEVKFVVAPEYLTLENCSVKMQNEQVVFHKRMMGERWRRTVH